MAGWVPCIRLCQWARVCGCLLSLCPPCPPWPPASLPLPAFLQLMDSVFNLRSYKVFASTAQCYGKGCVAPIFT